MNYKNKLILIFLIFSTVSMASYIDLEELGDLIGQNRVNMSKNGIPIGENSKVLDNYKLKNIPIFDKRENIDNEMKKTREETEERKKKYDSDTDRVNKIEARLSEISRFFDEKKDLEKKLKLYEDSNKELKYIRKKVKSELENNPQLFGQVKEYRKKLADICKYVYNTKGVDESNIENVRFVNNANEEKNFNLSKDKIKTLLNDNDVWGHLKLDDEKNLKTFLKDCAIYSNSWYNDYYFHWYAEYFVFDYDKLKDFDKLKEQDPNLDYNSWIIDNSFSLEKTMKGFLEAKGWNNNKIYESYKKFVEINKNLRSSLSSEYSHQGGSPKYFYERAVDKGYISEDTLEKAINEYKPKKKEYDSQAPSMEKENKDITTEKEEIEKRRAETASSDNVAHGTDACAVGIRSYAIGTNALTAGIDSVTIGSYSATFGNGSNSIGERNYTKGNKDQVFGVENITVGENNLVFGNHNLIHSNNNVILGSNIINTDVNNAVVIGNGSKAIENAVSIGNDTTTRQIKYVKAGTADTDAVNVKQLKDYVAANSFSAENYYNKAEVDKKLEGINAKSNLALGGVANAIAMSSMTQPREGLLNITGAYGTYGGEHALAVGISGNTERFSYKLGVSTNMRGNVGVGLGFGMTVVSSTKDDVIKRMEKKILDYMKESKEQNEKIKELENEMKELRKLIKKN